MDKSTLYSTTKVLPGNKIEIQTPHLSVGQTVEVIILVPAVPPNSAMTQDPSPSVEERLAFLKLPIAERRRILEGQAQKILAHYQEDSEWQELMQGDIIDY